MKLKYGSLILDISGKGVKINSEICVDVPGPDECRYYFYSNPAGNARGNPGNALPGLSIEPKNFSFKAFRCKPCIEEHGTSVKELYSYLFKIEDITIYFHGCSYMLCSIDEVLGEKIDILLLRLRLSLMSPEEASELVKTLKPTLTIPISFDHEAGYKFRDLAFLYTQVVLPVRCSAKVGG